MRVHNLVLLVVLAIAGCASVPHGTAWRGHSEGVVKVQLHYTGEQLPDSAWLVESSDSNGSGSVRFTKWGAAGYKYTKHGTFVVENAWRADARYLGVLRTHDGITEFCTLNPEHGAFMDGDSIVHTYSWDYCARLSRK